MTSTVSIRHLFISPGHNYFGHHGRPAGEHPVFRREEIECLAGRGIRDDRFLDFKPDYKGQITFYAWENLVRMWDDLEIPEIARDPAATRRNVITTGFEPGEWVGREFEIQGVRFFGAEECRPCYWMNGAIHPQAEDWMKGRGGLRARIFSEGRLRLTPAARLRAALMAGGKSIRMGADKARLVLDGVPLWQRQFGLLSFLTSHIAVAAPAPPDWMPADGSFVEDVPDAAGPLGGLLSALGWAERHGATHVLAVAVDMPGLTPTILFALWGACSPGMGVVPRGPKGPEPLAAVYPTQALPVLRERAAARKWKLRDAVEALVSAGICRELPFDASEAAPFVNVNSPADLLAVHRRGDLSNVPGRQSL